MTVVAVSGQAIAIMVLGAAANNGDEHTATALRASSLMKGILSSPIDIDNFAGDGSSDMNQDDRSLTVHSLADRDFSDTKVVADGHVSSIDVNESVTSCSLACGDIIESDEYLMFEDEEEDREASLLQVREVTSWINLILILHSMQIILTIPSHIEHRTTHCDRQFGLSQLSEKEKETAARCCYRYNRIALEVKEDAMSETSIQRYTRLHRRDQAALDMIRRHLIECEGHIGEAVRSCRATIQFREENHVNDIRSCFDRDGLTDEQRDLQARVQEGIGNIMGLKGFDKRGRVNIQIIPALATSESLDKVAWKARFTCSKRRWRARAPIPRRFLKAPLQSLEIHLEM